VVEQGEACDLLFDTAGGEALAHAAEQAGRIVTIVAETLGAHYFVVEPDREQLLELAQLAEAGELLRRSIRSFRSPTPAVRLLAAQPEESTARWCFVSSSRQQRKAKEFAVLHVGEPFVIRTRGTRGPHGC
jgi:hypothetical protein